MPSISHMSRDLLLILVIGFLSFPSHAKERLHSFKKIVATQEFWAPNVRGTRIPKAVLVRGSGMSCWMFWTTSRPGCWTSLVTANLKYFVVRKDILGTPRRIGAMRKHPGNSMQLAQKASINASR